MLAGLAVFSAVATEEEDYLRMIQGEAAKVGVIPNATPGPYDEARAASTKVGFEQELMQNYRGSFLFYKRLTVSGQEEIFLEYQRGASIEEIRNKIMSRFLR